MMKKLGFLTAAICMFSMILLPRNGYTKMTVMSNNELRQITGQAGITIQPEDIRSLNLDAERFAPSNGDEGHFGNELLLANAVPGMTFSDHSDLDREFATQIIGDSNGTMGINMTIRNLDVTVDEMTTDIRLGSDNPRDSLGIFTMRGLHVQISGNVRIYTRQ
jgi:hypothetical protein